MAKRIQKRHVNGHRPKLRMVAVRAGSFRVHRTDGFIPDSNPRFVYVQRVTPEAEPLVVANIRYWKELGKAEAERVSASRER